MIRFAAAALAATMLLATSGAHARPDSFNSVTQFCGDRVCGFKEPAPTFRNRAARLKTAPTRPSKPRHIARYPAQDRADPSRTAYEARIAPHPRGCPSYAFCGCGVLQHVGEAVARNIGLKPRDLWLASNWLRFPKAEPAPGMIAARHGHVFAILKVIGRGVVLAYDPNSGGHQTRIHVRSLAGFSVRNPRGHAS